MRKKERLLKNPKPYTLLENASVGLLLAGALSTVIISELLNTLNPVVWLPLGSFALSFLFILLLELILLGLVNRFSFAVMGSVLLVSLLSIVNHVKQYFRGDPLFAGDLVMAGDVDKVMGDLRYTPGIRVWVAALVFLLTLGIASRSRRRVQGLAKRLVMSSAALLLLSALIVGMIWSPKVRQEWLGIQDYAWNALANTSHNGFLVPFLRSAQDLVPGKKPDIPVPDSEYLVPALTGSDQPYDLDPAHDNKPNVICVMSESFSDFERINGLRASEPIMPFYRHLQQSDNTIDGSLLVSIFGGNTSNTEFEFLTGSSMHFVNDGLFPFKSWFQERTHGLVDLFNQQGYRSVGIHPFWSDYYERTRVYRQLGFEKYIALEQFPDEAERVHGYVSDRAHVEQIIRTFEEKGPDERLFLFTITMQNHFPYDRAHEELATLPYRIRLPDMTQAESAELFLSLLRVSDDALRDLVGYFEKVDEPTLIVLFGDHLPGLSESLRPFYEQLNGKTFAQLDLMETRQMYETPFMIWANYPLPEDNIDITSPNFLSATVADLADARLSPYYEFIKGLTKEFRAISNKILVLGDGTTIDRDHIPEELAYELSRYRRYHVDNIIRSAD